MNKLIAFVLASGMLLAETVYFSPNGKTYHASSQCEHLSKTKNVLHADRKDAEQHELKPCAICYKSKSTKGAKNAWAQKEGQK